MTDLRKRTTLKAISAAAATALAPAVASAALGKKIPLQGTGLELSFEPLANAAGTAVRQSVTIANASDTSVTLKHVYPGLVKSEGSLFDINDLLSQGPVTIQPGESRSFPISATAPNAVELPNPGGVIHSDLLTVSTRYESFDGVRNASTKRMLLS